MDMRFSTAISLALALIATSATFATVGKQTDNRAPVKLKMRHADPWAVKALLEGRSISEPELSTLWGVSPGKTGGQSNTPSNSPLVRDGTLVVNPTDNSLWWFPKK